MARIRPRCIEFPAHGQSRQNTDRPRTAQRCQYSWSGADSGSPHRYLGGSRSALAPLQCAAASKRAHWLGRGRISTLWAATNRRQPQTPPYSESSSPSHPTNDTLNRTRTQHIGARKFFAIFEKLTREFLRGISLNSTSLMRGHTTSTTHHTEHSVTLASLCAPGR